jgi:hypothetical protein
MKRPLKPLIAGEKGSFEIEAVLKEPENAGNHPLQMGPKSGKPGDRLDFLPGEQRHHLHGSEANRQARTSPPGEISLGEDGHIATAECQDPLRPRS